jgi:lysophospholipase
MRVDKISVVLVFVSLIFSAITYASATMFTNSFQLNTENQLNENYHSVINNFWEKNAQANYFLGVDKKTVYTVSIKTGNNKAIVICQGRNENTLKYKELAFDLNRQGYDLYLIDHRGQGFSERLGGDSYRAHVEQFQDYVDDLNSYVLSLSLPRYYQNSFLLSHSMGGTISALYLQQFDHPFQASVFFSPMFSINLGIPKPIAKAITYTSAKICGWILDKPCYLFGGHDYTTKHFIDNELTSSQLRFNLSAKTFVEYPKSQLGSPTMHWISESISAAQQAINNASKITIPTLIVQAGADTVVTSNGQNQFFKNLTFYKNNQLINIPGAKHEMLLEQDQYRIPALNKALTFLILISKNKPITKK